MKKKEHQKELNKTRWKVLIKVNERKKKTQERK